MQIPSQIPDNQMPLSPVDRRIDSLGTAANIHSPDDVEAYIDALLGKYEVDADSIPGLPPLVHRLATAEYASLADPSKRIPETRIADAFNQLMNEWGEPPWTRISTEDLHTYRRIKAATLMPYSVSRARDGAVSESCRPVEALYMIYLLSIERGTQSNIRPRIPENLGMSPLYAQSGTLTLKSGDPMASERNRAYLDARSRWLQTHVDAVQEVDLLMKMLQIN